MRDTKVCLIMNQFPQYQWTIWRYRTEKQNINSSVTTVVITEVMLFQTQEMGTTWLAHIVCSFLFYYKSTALRQIYEIQIYSTSLRSHSLNKVFQKNLYYILRQNIHDILYQQLVLISIQSMRIETYTNRATKFLGFLKLTATSVGKQWIDYHQTKLCMLCHEENMITHKKGKPKITLSNAIPFC